MPARLSNQLETVCALYLHRAVGQTAATRFEPQAQRCVRPLRHLPEPPSGKQRQPRLRRDTLTLSAIRHRRPTVHKDLFTEQVKIKENESKNDAIQ